MTSTAAWCAVEDLKREAPRGSEERGVWLEERLREHAEEILELRAELDEWRGVDPEVQSPSDLKDRLESLGEDETKERTRADEAEVKVAGLEFDVKRLEKELAHTEKLLEGAQRLLEEERRQHPRRNAVAKAARR